MGKIQDEIQSWVKEQGEKGGEIDSVGSLIERHEVVDKEDFYGACSRLAESGALMVVSKQDVDLGLQIHTAVVLMIGAHLGRKGLL